MATMVLMPKLGLTMDEGTITKWNFADGAQVNAGDVLYELETDKMTNEVVADAAGVLHIFRGEGDVVPTTEVVGVIAEPGEDVSAYKSGAPAPAAAPVQEEVASAPVASAPAAAPVSGGKVWASPKARAMAKAQGLDLAGVAGSGPEGLVVAADLAGGAGKVSPAAAKVAAATGVDLSSIQKDGRIMKQDVLDAVPLPGMSVPSQRVKMSAMRKAIAKNMLNSWNTIPAVTYDVRVDVSEMKVLKDTLSKSGQKISYTDILAKMVAVTLMEFPLVNSSIDGEDILYHKTVNLGIAVALDDGLVVPVIPNAERKGIGEISKDLKFLAANAREGRLTSNDMTGGTFTITNLGMFGVESFSPIVNPPESAILGVNAIVETPVVENGEVVVRPLMNLSLTADHRTVDGAVGAAFLQRLTQMIKNPWQLLM